MIKHNIKNKNQVEITDIVDRSKEENSIITITARNINPCQIDEQYISYVIDECGHLIKWRNLKGGYSYWLFDFVHEEEIKTKDLGKVNLPLDNQPKSLNDFEHFGFTAEKFYKMKSAVPITENEIAEIKTILLSNEVYIYKEKRYSGKIKWQRILMSSGVSKMEVGRIHSYQVEINIKFPKLNTPNLLWQ